MAFDFKKEYKSLYMPKGKPELIEVPPMKYIAVSGKGDPNIEDGEYKSAINILCAIAYTIKMSKMGERRPEGYFDFVVPPLEGFWRTESGELFDPSRKSDLVWISCIRMPDFVTEADIQWAKGEAAKKKGLDCSVAYLTDMHEGLCVQIMHTGDYDSEPATIALMHELMERESLASDMGGERLHHEIYLSDPRKTAREKLKTVIRLPVRRL